LRIFDARNVRDGATNEAFGDALRIRGRAHVNRVAPTLANDDPLAALLDELRAYAAFNFDRAPLLERMSGEFERAPAGLQHAAHLYEGESKMLGAGLRDILNKYHTVLSAPATEPVTRDFPPPASRSGRPTRITSSDFD
jgi:hypothetical protein